MKISQKTVSRALRYIRVLEHLIKQEVALVSSKQLASLVGLTDVQIRKDISNFGKIGTPRIGYNAAELKSTLEEFVLQQEKVHVALFGVGNLGTAILRYTGFHKDKIKIVAAFDVAENKIGRNVNGVSIYPLKRAPEVIRKRHVDIGVIAVPVEHSQEVADLMVISGLKGIINFSPTSICVPARVLVKNIDLTIEFLSLFCDMKM
ncbi:MAG TPA: redox-sensing transcriptional repressor Rex [Candidatus Omnitrophota bacterium]|nr:redox-sensing transcriptional repressor Rex [Candidatus Omnitrophota bacterium]